jgi:TolB-like protein
MAERPVTRHSLNLLGGFDLRDADGAAVAVRSKKGRCLLAYLALAQGRRKPRDELAALLWGDRGDTQARRSLSQELYSLRALFPEDVQSGFVLEAESVGLAEGLFAVDVVTFQRSLEAGDGEAAALYTGELLAGLEANQEGFDDWLRGERERLRTRAIAALEVRIHADEGDSADSADRLLTLDPANEAAHRALMRSHANAGRRDLALKQYDKCREVLARELGIEPDGETTALYESLKADAPTAEAGAAKNFSGTLKLPSKPSIAVLPLNNMSGDAEQDYFAEGMADDIITELSRSRDLFVIARNSSFAYQGRAADIKSVARELGVRYVLEGGVRKAGDRLRVQVQLIDAETGVHLWAEKYDGRDEDVFDLQDEITAKVTAAIGPSVLDSEIEKIRRKRPDSLDAYAMYLRGRGHYRDLDAQGLAEARKCFTAAIAQDGRLAAAYSSISEICWMESILGLGDQKQNLDEAVRSGRRAVEIDEADANAHVWISFSSLTAGQQDVALSEAERAVELNPNNALARVTHGAILVFTGLPLDGVEEIRLGLRLSPRDWYRFYFLHGLALGLYTARKYDEAAEAAQKIVTLKRDYIYGHWHLAASCAQLGQAERAKSALNELLRLMPNFNRDFVVTRAPYTDFAEIEHLIEGLRKAGLDV